MHPAGRLEFFEAGDVDVAPRAGFRTWREALGIALGVQRAPNAVNPAETERLEDRLLVGERTALARALLIEAEKCLPFGLVVLLEPGAEVIGGIEEEQVCHPTRS